MIKVEQPALALNAEEMVTHSYFMEQTLCIPVGQPLEKTVKYVVQMAGAAKGGKFRFLILNCHGFYDKRQGAWQASGGFGLQLGAGIHRSNVYQLAPLRGLVENIWIHACGTARQTNVGARGERDGGDGLMLCSEIARTTGAYVVAATMTQYASAQLPKYHIDDFDGVVLQFGPQGNVVWQHDYGRSLLRALTHFINPN